MLNPTVRSGSWAWVGRGSLFLGLLAFDLGVLRAAPVRPPLVRRPEALPSEFVEVGGVLKFLFGIGVCCKISQLGTSNLDNEAHRWRGRELKLLLP